MTDAGRYVLEPICTTGMITGDVFGLNREGFKPGFLSGPDYGFQWADRQEAADVECLDAPVMIAAGGCYGRGWALFFVRGEHA